MEKPGFKIKSFEYFCSRAVMLLGIFLTGVSIYSLLFTEQFLTNRTEAMEEIRDVMPMTLLFMAAVLTLSFFAVRLLLKNEEKRARRLRIFCIFTCIYTVVYGLWWTGLCKYYMIGDARLVSFFAEQLSFGIDDVSVADIQYLTSYPHQMGMVTFIEPLYRLCGWENYHAFQVLNALGAGLLVWLGVKLVWELSGREEACAYFLIFMLGCHPLLIYISFFYGEVLSVVFMFLALYLLLRCLKQGRRRDVVFLALALTAACLIRTNSYIVVAAVACVTVVKAIADRKPKLLLVPVICVLTFFVIHAALFQSYEKRLGLELDKGMPFSLWVAMGLQESIEDKEPGWFNKFSEMVFIEETNQDPEKSRELAAAAIKTSLETFRENPDYAKLFFRRKLASMWNEPTYACLLETSRRVEERSALADRLYKGDLWRPFTRVMDVYQSLIYCGSLLFLLLSIRKKIPVEHLSLLIVILGGFLFYIFWEAKSRYIFPYFMAMIPMAAVGYDLLLGKLKNRKEWISGQKGAAT